MKFLLISYHEGIAFPCKIFSSPKRVSFFTLTRRAYLRYCHKYMYFTFSLTSCNASGFRMLLYSFFSKYTYRGNLFRVMCLRPLRLYQTKACVCFDVTTHKKIVTLIFSNLNFLKIYLWIWAMPIAITFFLFIFLSVLLLSIYIAITKNAASFKRESRRNL